MVLSLRFQFSSILYDTTSTKANVEIWSYAMGGILALIFFGFGTEARSIYVRAAGRLGCSRPLRRQFLEKSAGDMTPISLQATRYADLHSLAPRWIANTCSSWQSDASIKIGLEGDNLEHVGYKGPFHATYPVTGGTLLVHVARYEETV
jgi:hypothetical protein